MTLELIFRTICGEGRNRRGVEFLNTSKDAKQIHMVRKPLQGQWRDNTKEKHKEKSSAPVRILFRTSALL